MASFILPFKTSYHSASITFTLILLTCMFALSNILLIILFKIEYFFADIEINLF